MPICNTFRDKKTITHFSGYYSAIQRATVTVLQLHYVEDQPKVVE